MTHDVGQRFLEHAEHRRLLFLAEQGQLAIDADVAAQTRPCAEGDRFPLDGGRQSEMIEGGRPQLSTDSFDGFDADFDQADERLQAVDRLRRDVVLGQGDCRAREFELDGRQRLAELVVELSGRSAARSSSRAV